MATGIHAIKKFITPGWAERREAAYAIRMPGCPHVAEREKGAGRGCEPERIHGIKTFIIAGVGIVAGADCPSRCDGVSCASWQRVVSSSAGAPVGKLCCASELRVISRAPCALGGSVSE